MKDTAETAKLRTLLRNVNMAYSALLRGSGHESKLARLGALKEQRLALMSRIAELRRRQAAQALPTTRHPREPAVAKLSQTLSAPMLRARAMAATVLRYWAGWLGGSQVPSEATAVPSSEQLGPVLVVSSGSEPT
jgi:hypothetical protein